MFVDVFDYEAEGFADGGVVGLLLWSRRGGGGSTGDDLKGIACAGARDQEAGFLEGGEGEEMLIAVCLEDLLLEVLEVFEFEAAVEGAHEAEKAEDCG